MAKARCSAKTKKGKPCKNTPVGKLKRCSSHQK